MKKHLLPGYIFHIAQGFLDIGMHLAREVKSDQSIHAFQRIPAAVVNFSFAIELTLKGLCQVSLRKSVEGHDFVKLYNQIPKEVQLKVEQKFNEKKTNLSSELTSFTINVYDKKIGSNFKETSIDASKISIIDLLEVHKNSFVNWRYLFEIPDGGYTYQYDFKLMFALVASLIDVTNELHDKEKEKFIVSNIKNPE